MTYHLYVFGSNGEGQLGIPAAEIVNTPTLVPGPPPLDNLKVIKSGDNHTIFLTGDDSVYGVGDNRKDQLRSSPGAEPRVPSFKNLNMRPYSLAATCESSAYITKEDTSTQSWIYTEGSGQWGELGRGDDITTTTGSNSQGSYISSALPRTVIDFAAGVWHYVAILEDGSIYGWGKARHGQLGDTVSNKATAPTKLKDLPFKAVKAICGKDFTYIVSHPSTGEHVLLGKDKFNIDSAKPAHIKGWKQIGATWHAIFVLFDDGSLNAWGKENMWKLLPPNLPRIEKIAVGSDHVLALTKEGKLISWGWGKHGNCGDLTKVQHLIKNDMVSGFWNEIMIPGEIQDIAAGFCTSFVIGKQINS